MTEQSTSCPYCSCTGNDAHDSGCPYSGHLDEYLKLDISVAYPIGDEPVVVGGN